MFDPCSNLAAGAGILSRCFETATDSDSAEALKNAFSCYYSGKHNSAKYYRYVNRVVGRARMDISSVTVDTSSRWRPELRPITIHKNKSNTTKKLQTQPSRQEAQSPMVSYSAGTPSTNNAVINLGDQYPN